MKEIRGRVTSREHNTPVPNIVVAAYDARVGIGDLSSSPRLGASVTDDKGEFVLAFDRAAQANQHQQHPAGLTVAVFAPEDAPSRVAAPKPLSDRLLYLSAPIIDTSGLSEAVSIRLPVERVEEVMGDPIVRARHAATAAGKQIIASIEATKTLRGHLAASRKEADDARSKMREEAKVVVAKLHALPPHLSSPEARERNFVLVGKKEAAAKLKEYHGRATAAGFERLSKVKVRALRVSVPRDLIERLLNEAESLRPGRQRAHQESRTSDQTAVRWNWLSRLRSQPSSRFKRKSLREA